jgi:hypothetical protein
MTDATAKKKEEDLLEMQTGLPLARRTELLASAASNIYVAGIDHRARPQISTQDAIDFAMVLLGEAFSESARKGLEAVARNPREHQDLYHAALRKVNDRIRQHAQTDQQAEIDAINKLTAANPNGN